MLAVEVFQAVAVGDGHDLGGVVVVLTGTVHFQLYAKEAVAVSAEQRLRFVVIVLNRLAGSAARVAVIAERIFVAIALTGVIGLADADDITAVMTVCVVTVIAVLTKRRGFVSGVVVPIDALTAVGAELSRCKANIDDRWPYQLLELAANGVSTMRRVLRRLVSDMPYYTLSAIREYLGTTDISNAKRKNLLDFLEKINRYDLLDKKRIKDKEKFKNGKKRLKQLKKLGINPVTIEARAGIPYLPSLEQLIAAGL